MTYHLFGLTSENRAGKPNLALQLEKPDKAVEREYKEEETKELKSEIPLIMFNK